MLSVTAKFDGMYLVEVNDYHSYITQAYVKILQSGKKSHLSLTNKKPPYDGMFIREDVGCVINNTKIAEYDEVMELVLNACVLSALNQ